MNGMQDYWTGLFAFVRTAEAGSFTKAAQALGTSSSAVSRAVSRVEHRLGTTLFKRSTRSLALSRDGQRFLEQVAPLIEELRSVEQMFDGRRPPSGTVRVSAPIDLGRTLIASWADAFSRDHPDLRLELNITDRLVDLRREAVDIAVRLGSEPSAGVAGKTVGSLGYAVVASSRYVELRGRPDEPGDLAGHACLQYITNDGTPLRWTFAGKALATSGPLATDDGGALLTAALHGAGIAYMLHFAVEAALADGRLTELLPDVPKAELRVSLSHPFGARPPRRVTAALGFLQARLAQAV